MGFFNAMKHIAIEGYKQQALFSNTMMRANEAIAKAGIAGTQEGMERLMVEANKAKGIAFDNMKNKFGSIKKAMNADAAEWGEGKLKRLGLKDVSEVENMGAGQTIKAAFLNNDGSISKASVAGAYMGTNIAVNGHLGIPLISDSDREITSGTTSALVGGGAYALARKFL